MSRSKKKPIYKDKQYGYQTVKIHNRIIRRVQNNKIRDIINLKDIESYDIPNSKIIIDDYNYIDYIIDLRFEKHNNYWKNIRNKLSRK